MSQSSSAEAALRLRRLIADGLESGDGRRLTCEVVEELRHLALGAGERSS